MSRLNKLALTVSLVLVLFLSPAAGAAQDQWPPFSFRLIPSYEDGKITYNIRFFSRVDWPMTNLTFKVPIPEGTRFLEANAQPTTNVSFDGTEVTFFSAVYYPIRNAYFVVEVADPSLAEYSNKIWISWEGEQPGSYLIEDFTFDISKQPLDWEPPAESRLQLELSAEVDDDIITYTIYPKNAGRSARVRMQDVEIRVLVPENTTFLLAEALPPFASNGFDGREVSFSALELEKDAEVSPLKLQVSTGGIIDPLVSTYAWASWKNAGKYVGVSVPAQEQFRTGDIVVLPNTSWVIADPVGDVPFADYDITSVAFQKLGSGLGIVFQTAGALGPVGEPLEYYLYIDSDCNQETGLQRSSIGADYRVRYRHSRGRADISFWDEQEDKWSYMSRTEVNDPVGGKTIAIRLFEEWLESSSQLCWFSEVRDRTNVFYPFPPREYVPSNAEPRVTHLEWGRIESGTAVQPAAADFFEGDFIEAGDVWTYLPGWTDPPADWNTIGFDDTAWFTGPTSIGYGGGNLATDLSRIIAPLQSEGGTLLVRREITQTGVTLVTLPSGEATSVYMRRTFDVPDPAEVSQLNLQVQGRSGFIAYLNGVEVARRGLGSLDEPVSYDSMAEESLDTSAERFDISGYVDRLVSGMNVLAIQAHKSAGDGRLSITPELSWEYNPLVASSDDSGATTAAASSLPPLEPSTGDISGKLAVPIDNGSGFYDIHVLQLPDGQGIVRVPNARQPHIRFDGQRMLINREGGGRENLFEYNFADGTERQVSDAPRDSHPVYDSWGNRVAYANSELTVGSGVLVPNRDDQAANEVDRGARKPFIFVQCGLLPPHQETEPRCRDITGLGVLVPAGQVGEIQGTHPVWTSDDMIVYKGCNTWSGSQLCGIYAVPSASTKGFSDGFIPRQLTRDASDTPGDTKGNLIAFTSRRDGDWEVYVMDLNGTAIVNLSASPNSNDGLPAISPDGSWVAFVSDRSGQWAVWVAPATGGTVQKLFDLPGSNVWGSGDRVWTNERISWGP